MKQLLMFFLLLLVAVPGASEAPVSEEERKIRESIQERMVVVLVGGDRFVMVLNTDDPQGPNYWFSGEDTDLDFLGEGLCTLQIVQHLEVSPDRNYLAVVSYGEGGNWLELFKVKTLFGPPPYNCIFSLNPYPGGVSSVGWRNNQLHVLGAMDLVSRGNSNSSHCMVQNDELRKKDEEDLKRELGEKFLSPYDCEDHDDPKSVDLLIDPGSGTMVPLLYPTPEVQKRDCDILAKDPDFKKRFCAAVSLGEWADLGSLPCLRSAFKTEGSEEVKTQIQLSIDRIKKLKSWKREKPSPPPKP